MHGTNHKSHLGIQGYTMLKHSDSEAFRSKYSYTLYDFSNLSASCVHRQENDTKRTSIGSTTSTRRLCDLSSAGKFGRG